MLECAQAARENVSCIPPVVLLYLSIYQALSYTSSERRRLPGASVGSQIPPRQQWDSTPMTRFQGLEERQR